MRQQKVEAWLPPFLSITRTGDSLLPPVIRTCSSSTSLIRSKTVERGEDCWGQLLAWTTTSSLAWPLPSSFSLMVRGMKSSWLMRLTVNWL